MEKILYFQTAEDLETAKQLFATAKEIPDSEYALSVAENTLPYIFRRLFDHGIKLFKTTVLSKA